MNFLKGLVVSLLSLLLFLSLSLFGLVFMLNQTVLNPDFITSQVEKLDMSSLTKELIIPQLPSEFKDNEFVTKALDNTFTDLEPRLKEQAGNAIHQSYDYLLGKSQSLSFTISLEQFKTTLRDNLRQTFLANPPRELRGMPPAQLDQYFDQFYNQFATEIPSSIEVDENMLDPVVITQLEQARQIIGYVQLGFWALIGAMVVLILGIFLIQRNLRATSRSLGITFLIYGILGYLMIFVTKSWFMPQIPLPQLPIPALESWALQFTKDLISPLEIFGIGVAAVGVALIAASFFLKPRQESV